MKVEFAWHIHHTTLMEPLTEPLSKRISYICTNKPANEQKRRLRLLAPIKGKLSAPLLKAGGAFVRARTAYIKEQDNRGRTNWSAYDAVKLAYDKACHTYARARVEATPEIEELHKVECPNCPWNGNTILPERPLTWYQ